MLLCYWCQLLNITIELSEDATHSLTLELSKHLKKKKLSVLEIKYSRKSK